MDRHVYAVLGAGNGGQAMAGYLALRGYPVRLWNRSPGRLASIWRTGGIRVNGVIRGFAPISLATNDLAAAIEGADILMVVLPATAHRPLAQALASLLVQDQIIVLNPGRTGGSLEVRNTLAEYRSPAEVIVSEAQTMLFASRLMDDGSCHIYSIKKHVSLAAVPAEDTATVIGALNPAFPHFYPAASVLETGLDNMGAIFHPGVTLLNAARIEATGGDFDYYQEGVTPTVARVIEQIDNERMEVARAYRVRARSAREWLAEAYGAHGDTLHQAVLNNPGYAGIKAPPHLNHRYIWEDVPTSLVPIADLGRIAGVATPTINAMIALACSIHDTDYWREGRNAVTMGIAGLRLDEVRQLVHKGETPFADIGYVAQDPTAGNQPG